MFATEFRVPLFAACRNAGSAPRNCALPDVFPTRPQTPCQHRCDVRYDLDTWDRAARFSSACPRSEAVNFEATGRTKFSTVGPLRRDPNPSPPRGSDADMYSFLWREPSVKAACLLLCTLEDVCDRLCVPLAASCCRDSASIQRHRNLPEGRAPAFWASRIIGKPSAPPAWPRRNPLGECSSPLKS